MTSTGEDEKARTAITPSLAVLFDAVLFDRDGTLVVDEPYNSDPELVVPIPGAVNAVATVRRAGVRTGVLSNQSGIARGLLTGSQVEAVNRRVDALFGAFDVWEICPHAPHSDCRCRKPKPGMIFAACRELGISPSRTAFVGDIGSDVDAARAAGAVGVLVPTAVTLAHEVAQSRLVAETLDAALQLLLDICATPTLGQAEVPLRQQGLAIAQSQWQHDPKDALRPARSPR
ncbi:HAD-IIIA family hydrolase [Paenarthrobacter sp. PH39-S1]|uniref:D-glycero-alpha-D-manno-heptose-1,7-bisphosphate 7-phosphatase n=1 Tax=Paenarthrobacter sp. PH39-S1 TaxID=3046204 RepID=UPI0024B937E5|nr:HAD-IIIA family hydrolase [Paenarthrobacter sp. PH39-S1]MDJ0355357.1 HAD-IIIA family hydrolase [Paenarthrobacter sp. PH39-S1]